jgi:mono/diheme cytochrome c family protein
VTQRSFLRLALSGALLAAAAGSAVADEPGPGGSKPIIPVTGEQVYRTVCQACHMAGGKGAVGAAAFPALANNSRLGAAAYPIFLVVKGRTAMPGFTDLLSPTQIATVVTYIRTNFGNSYPAPVTAAEVSAIAGLPAGQ